MTAEPVGDQIVFRRGWLVPFAVNFMLPAFCLAVGVSVLKDGWGSDYVVLLAGMGFLLAGPLAFAAARWAAGRRVRRITVAKEGLLIERRSPVKIPWEELLIEVQRGMFNLSDAHAGVLAAANLRAKDVGFLSIGTKDSQLKILMQSIDYDKESLERLLASVRRNHPVPTEMIREV